VDPGILQQLAHRLIPFVSFVASGAIIGIAAVEIDSRFIRSHGMQALG